MSTQMFVFAMVLGALLASIVWSHRYQNLQARCDYLEDEYFYSKKYDPRER